jgi:hypothetical protein
MRKRLLIRAGDNVALWQIVLIKPASVVSGMHDILDFGPGPLD